MRFHWWAGWVIQCIPTTEWVNNGGHPAFPVVSCLNAAILSLKLDGLHLRKSCEMRQERQPKHHRQVTILLTNQRVSTPLYGIVVISILITNNPLQYNTYWCSFHWGILVYVIIPILSNFNILWKHFCHIIKMKYLPFTQDEGKCF